MLRGIVSAAAIAVFLSFTPVKAAELFSAHIAQKKNHEILLDQAKRGVYGDRVKDEVMCAMFGGITGFWAFTPDTAGSSTIIQSIQEVSVTASGAATGDATVTSVSTSNAHLVFSGWNTNNTGTNSSNIVGRVELTSATNVRITRQGISNDLTAGCYVVEFVTGTLNSVQQGTVALTASATTATATITSVTTANSAIYWLGQVAVSSGTIDGWGTRASLTSATEVTLTRGAAITDDVTMGYVVAEYASGKLNSSTQQFSISLATGGTTSNTASVSATTLAQTMTAYGGYSSDGTTNDFTRLPWLQLTSTTQYTATRTTGTNTVAIAGTAVEYKVTNITGIDRGSVDIAATATTGDVTIGAIVIAKSIAACMGQSATVNAGNFSNKWAKLTITSTTNMRSTINASNATAVNRMGYEVGEWV